MIVNRIIRLAAAILVSVAAMGAEAQDYTSYSAKTTSPDILVYNPASPVSAVASLTIQRGNNANVAYPYYYIVAGASQGLAGPGQRRLYLDGQVSKPSIPVFLRLKNSIMEIGSANISDSTSLSGSVYRRNPSTVELDVVLDANAGSIPDGTYTNQFTFALYTNTSLAPTATLVPPNGQEAMSVQGSLAINVTATVSLSSVKVQFSASAMSFGTDLAEGSRYETGGFVHVDATKPFEVSVMSQNFGAIKLGGSSESIAYTFLFNGTPYSLSAGTALIGQVLPAGTQSYPIQFVLEKVPNAEAGDYTDIITFYFSTQ